MRGLSATPRSAASAAISDEGLGSRIVSDDGGEAGVEPALRHRSPHLARPDQDEARRPFGHRSASIRVRRAAGTFRPIVAFLPRSVAFGKRPRKVRLRLNQPVSLKGLWRNRDGEDLDGRSRFCEAFPSFRLVTFVKPLRFMVRKSLAMWRRGGDEDECGDCGACAGAWPRWSAAARRSFNPGFPIRSSARATSR